MNMRNMLPEPEQVLVKCPQCAAWPMSLAPQVEIAPSGQITFRCPKCQRLETFRIGVAGGLIPTMPTGR